MSKRIKCAAMLGMLVLSAGLLAGCGGNSAKSLLRKSVKAQQKQEMSASEWTMDMGLVMDADETLGLSVDMSAEVTASSKTNLATGISASTLDLALDVYGSRQHIAMEFYSEDGEKNTRNVYGNLLGDWTRIHIPVSRDASKKGIAALAGEFTLAETTSEIDGAACRILSASLSGSELLSVIPELREITYMQSWEEALASDALFDVTYALDENTMLPVKLEIHAETVGGENRQTSGEEESSATEEETRTAKEKAEDVPASLTLSDLSMEIHYSWPEKTEIVVPEDAREAAEGTMSNGFDNPNEGSRLNTLENPQIVREYDPEDEGCLLYNEQGIRLRLARVYKDENGSAFADVEVSNSSAGDIEVYSTGAALNGIMTTGSFYLAVRSGSTDIASIEFILPGQAELPGTIGSIDLDFQATDSITYDTILDTQSYHLVIEGEKDVAPKEGTVLWEDDNLQIVAYPETKDNLACTVPIGIYNHSGRKLSVYTETVEKAGEELPVVLATDAILPGTVTYTELALESSAAKKYDVDSLSGTELIIAAEDADTYENIVTTSHISLP